MRKLKFRISGLGALFLREKAALDSAVDELHVVPLNLEVLAVLQLNHVAPSLFVKALDDGRLPVVLCSL